MKQQLLVLVVLLLLAIPGELFAKATTSKIIIKGANLSAPIEITDPSVLAKFFVWTGAGTSCTGCSSPPSTQSFIVDWSHPMADHPGGLHRYEVSFYAKMPDERLIYVVFYEFAPASEHGTSTFPVRVMNGIGSTSVPFSMVWRESGFTPGAPGKVLRDR